MTLLRSSSKELKLIPLVLLVSLLLLMQFQSVVSCSSPCCFHQRTGGLLRGRRLLMSRRHHGEAIFAKGLMEPVVVAKGGRGGALGEEDKREVITGPNPLHNRR
jgi:hypothetical protein